MRATVEAFFSSALFIVDDYWVLFFRIKSDSLKCHTPWELLFWERCKYRSLRVQAFITWTETCMSETVLECPLCSIITSYDLEICRG